MTTLGTTYPTLLDVANRTDPNGQISVVAEILNQVSDVLDDIPWLEGNLATGHVTSIRTGIPEPTYRKIYGGVQPTKSTSAKVTANCGMMEDYAEVDKALADMNGNAPAWRMSEDRAHIEGFAQKLSTYLFMGNEATEPEAITGFGPLFNDLSAQNADNIIDAGGTGSDNASIYLVGWGETTCHGIYPKGSTAGLQVNDKGQVTIENVDGNNGRMEGYRTHYKWDHGLVVRDWRYVVRICNIDRSLLSTVYTAGTFATGANLPLLLTDALELIPNLGACRPAFYMDRSIRSMLRKQLAAMSQNSTLTVENIGGRRIVKFDEVPLRRVDALSANETRVV